MVDKLNINDVITNEDSEKRRDEYLISNVFLYSLKNKLITSNGDYELIKDAENIVKFDNIQNTNRVYRYLENKNIDEIKEYIKDCIKDCKRTYKYFNTSVNDSLNELCIKLLNINNNDSIFNLGIGLSNFIYDLYDYLNKENINVKSIKGMDLEKNKVVLGNMVLSILLNNINNISLNDIDIFSKLEINENKGVAILIDRYDSLKQEKLIDSNYDDIKFNYRNNVEWIAIDRILSNKNIERLVAIIPSRILYSENDKEYRNKLIKNGLVESIIELPSNVVNDLSFKTCIMVFSKNNSNIKLLDVNSISNEVSKDDIIKLDTSRIMELYSKDDIKSISINDACNQNNLIPSTLLIKLNNNFEGIKLSEVAKVINGSQYTLRNFEKYLSNEETSTKLLTISDIDLFNINFDELKCINVNDSKYDKFLLEEGDIVITSKSSKVKIGVVDQPLKDKIIVTGGMMIIRPDKSKLDSRFLKMYLDSSLGQLAIKSIQKGEVIVSLYTKDINELIIPKIDIEIQKELSKEYDEKLSKLIEYKKKVNELENELSSFYDNNKN